MIVCIGPTPAAQRVMVFKQFRVDEVNRAAATLDGAAGKAVNVAKVLKSLGEPSLYLGLLGGDHGRQIRAELERRQIGLACLDLDAPTRQCITIIDENAGTQTELVEESRSVPDSVYDQLLAMLQQHLRGAQAAIMSGTLTPGAPRDFYAHCVRLARQNGLLTVVDAQGAALTQSLGERPALVKPNRTELATTCGFELSNQHALFQAMRSVCEQGAERVVITSGKAPTLAFDGAKFFRVLPVDIQAANPIGSGDAFTAGLAWRLTLGDDLPEACRWGAACGAANALTLSPGDLERADVSRLLSQVRVEPA